MGTAHEVQNHPKVIEAYIGVSDPEKRAVA
ncbi:hypothetical protein AB4144_40730 [Rhizobiaceae sp. 2RAB30]